MLNTYRNQFLCRIRLIFSNHRRSKGIIPGGVEYVKNIGDLGDSEFPGKRPEMKYGTFSVTSRLGASSKLLNRIPEKDMQTMGPKKLVFWAS